MAQTLADVAPGSISDRKLTSPPAGYTMNALTASPRKERASAPANSAATSA